MAFDPRFAAMLALDGAHFNVAAPMFPAGAMVAAIGPHGLLVGQPMVAHVPTFGFPAQTPPPAPAPMRVPAARPLRVHVPAPAPVVPARSPFVPSRAWSGAGVIVVNNDSLILGRDARTGDWDVFGGAVSHHDHSPEDTASRELAEETGGCISISSSALSVYSKVQVGGFHAFVAHPAHVSCTACNTALASARHREMTGVRRFPLATTKAHYKATGKIVLIDDHGHSCVPSKRCRDVLIAAFTASVL